MVKTKKINYKDILDNFNMNQLTEICRRYDFRGYSKFKKAEMVDFINNNIFDKDTFEKIVISMNNHLIECMLNDEYIVNGSENINYIQIVRNSFGCLDNKTNEIFIAADIKKEIKKIFTPEFEEKYNFYRSIITYCRALTELWGIVPFEKILEIYNNQNNIHIEQSDLDFAIECSKYAIDCYYVPQYNESRLINESLFVNNGDVEKLLKAQKNKSYYIPDKMQLIRYSDDHYFDETPFCSDMSVFLAEYGNLHKNIADELTDEISLMARMNCNYQDILYYLEQYHIVFNQEDINKFFRIYMGIYNNSRLWENCGYTPSEMITISQKGSVPVTHKKVGRNDPCPCGSGKKYKKCCGKNE